jgi:hypothetical protein
LNPDPQPWNQVHQLNLIIKEEILFRKPDSKNIQKSNEDSYIMMQIVCGELLQNSGQQAHASSTNVGLAIGEQGTQVLCRISSHIIELNQHGFFLAQ